MKKVFILLLSVIFYSSIYSQGYTYTIRVDGLSDTVLYMGHHYGDKQYVIDTVRTNDKGVAVFSGNSPLPGGMYLIAIPSMKNKYFEFLLDGKENQFSLETDTLDLSGHMKVTGSLENKLFYEDLAFVNARRQLMTDMKAKMIALGEDSEEGKAAKAEMLKINDEVENERLRIIEKYPDLFYAKFLKAITEVKIPDPPLNPDGTKDSTFAYYFIYAHFFDNVDFSDERFLRTNVIDSRIRKYLKDYVVKIPDSINNAIDIILAKASADSSIFQYASVMLLNEYFNSKIMGFDAVYIHVVDKVYKSGHAFWIDDVDLYKMLAQADKYRPTLIGLQAPQLLLQDTLNRDIPLYSVRAKYTIVIFWDVDCGHCKKEMPKLLDIYPQIKDYGGEVYAAYTQEEWDKWKKWLFEKNYPWINVGNMKLKSDYQVKYNVDQTPLILILDANKKIIAKRIGVDQILDILKDQEAGN